MRSRINLFVSIRPGVLAYTKPFSRSYSRFKMGISSWSPPSGTDILGTAPFNISIESAFQLGNQYSWRLPDFNIIHGALGYYQGPLLPLDKRTEKTTCESLLVVNVSIKFRSSTNETHSFSATGDALEISNFIVMVVAKGEGFNMGIHCHSPSNTATSPASTLSIASNANSSMSATSYLARPHLQSSFSPPSKVTSIKRSNL
jgi:hypothetical protein